MFFRSTSTRRGRLVATLGRLIAFAAAAAACLPARAAEGGSELGAALASLPQAGANQVVTGYLEGFPHEIDVYRPAGATHAIVVLHGGGGNKTSVAYQLGMNDNPDVADATTVNWAWLAGTKTMLVLPQGQHIKAEPNATTWRNYAMDSGEDDVAFLQALAARVREATGLARVTLLGHSMGGVMSNRVWCESPETFDANVSLAGPASTTFNRADTPCQPGAAAKPYLGIIGDEDEVMRDGGKWTAAKWTINPLLVLSSRKAWDNDEVIGEFHRQQERVAMMCGETVAENGFKRQGNVDTWRNCSGRLVLKRVLGAQHAITSIEDRMGEVSTTDVMDRVLAFLLAQKR